MVSRESSNTSASLCPSSVRNEMPVEFMGPRVSRARGWKMCDYYYYFMLFVYLHSYTCSYQMCTLIKALLLLLLLMMMMMLMMMMIVLRSLDESVLQTGVLDSWKRPAKLVFCALTSLSLVYTVVSCFSLRLSTDPPSIQSAIGRTVSLIAVVDLVSK